jgi:hypothetical protein
MVFTSRLAAAGAAMALVTLPQAQTPPPQPENGDPQAPVVVTGQRPDIDLSAPKPMLHGGQWRFSRVPTGTRPIDFTTCLQNDDLETALRRMAAEKSNQPSGQRALCGAMKLTIAGGRIVGRRSCLQAHGMGTSHSDIEYSLSGRYDAHKLTLNATAAEITDGFAESPRSAPRPKMLGWHVTATRLGDCPLHPDVRVRTIDEASSMLFSPDVSGSELDGL